MSSGIKDCKKDVDGKEGSDALLEAIRSDKGLGSGVVQESESGILIRTTVQYKERAPGGSGYRTHVQLMTQSVSLYEARHCICWNLLSRNSSMHSYK